MDNIPIVKDSVSIRQAMRVVDRCGLGLAFVVDSQAVLVGVVSDGDVRRALLAGKGLDEPVSSVMNRKFVSLPAGLSPQDADMLARRKEVAERIPKDGVLVIPLCDVAGSVKGVYFAHPKHEGPGPHKIFSHKPVKRILVTGGGGYIGSVLVRRLLESGYHVRVMDKFIYTEDGLTDLKSNSSLEIMRGDVLDIADLAKAVKDVGAVVHFAEIVGDPATALDPEITVANNVVAAVALAQLCKYFQINRFVYASSCSVYGSSEQDWVNEDAPTNPVSLYARAKLESEKALLALADENFSPTLLRFSTVFGISPRMRFDLVVNAMAADGFFKGKIRVAGGSQWRPLVHVQDVSAAVQSVLEADLSKVAVKAFNVGGDDNNYTIIDLAGEIKTALERRGRKVSLDVATENKDARSYRVSFAKIKDTLGFRPSYSVASAVDDLCLQFEKGKYSDYGEKKYSNFLSWQKEKSRLRRRLSQALSSIAPNLFQ